MADLMLPRGKEKILKAEDKTTTEGCQLNYWTMVDTQ